MGRVGMIGGLREEGGSMLSGLEEFGWILGAAEVWKAWELQVETNGEKLGFLSCTGLLSLVSCLHRCGECWRKKTEWFCSLGCTRLRLAEGMGCWAIGRDLLAMQRAGTPWQ